MDERQALQLRFAMLDDDASGELDAVEFRAAIGRLGVSVAKKDAATAGALAALFAHWDRDASGTIEKDEFTGMRDIQTGEVAPPTLPKEIIAQIRAASLGTRRAPAARARAAFGERRAAGSAPPSAGAARRRRAEPRRRAPPRTVSPPPRACRRPRGNARGGARPPGRGEGRRGQAARRLLATLAGRARGAEAAARALWALVDGASRRRRRSRSARRRRSPRARAAPALGHRLGALLAGTIGEKSTRGKTTAANAGVPDALTVVQHGDQAARTAAHVALGIISMPPTDGEAVGHDATDPVRRVRFEVLVDAFSSSAS